MALPSGYIIQTGGAKPVIPGVSPSPVGIKPAPVIPVMTGSPPPINFTLPRIPFAPTPAPPAPNRFTSGGAGVDSPKAVVVPPPVTVVERAPPGTTVVERADVTPTGMPPFKLPPGCIGTSWDTLNCEALVIPTDHGGSGPGSGGSGPDPMLAPPPSVPVPQTPEQAAVQGTSSKLLLYGGLGLAGATVLAILLRKRGGGET